MGTIEKRARVKNGEVLRDHGKPVFRWRAVVRLQGRMMSQTFDLKADADAWIAQQKKKKEPALFGVDRIPERDHA